MYLKSLEIHGFKSFPDKIRLDFDKGITAVVGPNGSGKSNIGDAVRWVLGEQSSKTLRGAKMEDVIFAGTELRRPMGFASVTLCIVNTGELDISADEVNITRKLYRSGESEYLINGAQVRLKDISELFMDTGLGRDGYSIVGQGKVAEIVSSKSAERRSIFEEAAGISRSRYRKEDAENRLVKAEENIVRLEDIAHELKERVEPLRIQSEKAEKFVVLAERRKALEITVWLAKIDEIGEKIKSLEEKLLINQGEYDNAGIDIRKQEEREQELSREINLTGIAIERIQGDILDSERKSSESRSQAAVLENEIGHINAKIEELKERLKECGEQGEDTARKIDDKKDEVKQCAADISALEKEIMELQDSLLSADEKSGKLDDEQSEQERALNRLYIRRTELNAGLAAAQRSLEEQEDANAEEQKRLQGLSEDMAALEREREEIDSAYSVIDEKIDEQTNRINGTKIILQGKEKKLAAREQENNDTLTQIRVQGERRRILNDLENAMEGYSGAARAVLRAAKSSALSGICGTVSQLITIAPEYVTAIETALGGALQNIVTENEDAAKKGIRLLKERNAGRATFLPLTTVTANTVDTRSIEGEPGFVDAAYKLVSAEPKFDRIVKNLLGRIIVAEDIDSAGDIARKMGFKFRIVTLDGQVVNAGGSYTGGSVNKSSGILSRKNEIAALDMEIEGLKAAAEEAKSVLLTSRDEVQRLRVQLSAAEEELSVMRSDKVRFESEMKRISDVKAQLAASQETAKESAARLEEKRAEVQKTAEDTAEKLKALGGEIEQMLLSSSDTGSKREELRREREAAAEELSTKKIGLAQRKMDKTALEKDIDNLRLRSEQAGDLSVKYTEEIEECNAKIAEHRSEIEIINNSLKSDSGEVAALYEEIGKQKAENAAREREIGEIRKALRESNAQREALGAERSRLEERIGTAKNDQDRIISDMYDTYEMYAEEARELTVEGEPKELEKELVTVRNKIRSLGNVNLAAIEEYKEVSERYGELSRQLDDVNRSKRELERLIDELTAQMKEKFTDSFNEINTRFKTIFTELFGGGRAELSLSDPDNVLESGIEIKVAPPGKVIGNLSLLSGGEQAFVAIAIYFAILRVRPAPFCILDEIEAALDDVNVSKYAHYLHNYTDTTQFITITHRRGTMEEADIFYGVTMQEKGISRLLRMEQTNSGDEEEIIVSD